MPWVEDYCGVRHTIPGFIDPDKRLTTDSLCTNKSKGHDGDHECVCGLTWPQSPDDKTDAEILALKRSGDKTYV